MLKYQDGRLHFFDHPLDSVAKGESDPVYVYIPQILENRIQFMLEHLPPSSKVHYAMKANGNKDLLGTVKKLQQGLDVVSGGEIEHGIDCGFDAKDIVFSGVGKTEEEIDYAITCEIRQINVESIQELQRIIARAQFLKKKVSVALRVNPDVNPETHPYITTGFRNSKFGIPTSQIREFLELIAQNKPHLEFVGLTCHIGSQLLELSSTREAFEKVKRLYLDIKSQGHPLSRLDLGGGVGVHYEGTEQEDFDLMSSYCQMTREIFSDFSDDLLFEPGRWLVARTGVLLAEVQYTKNNGFKDFMILNTGMHHLARPCLYGSYHQIWPLIEASDRQQLIYDVVGPICESSDFLGKDRRLHEVRPGERVAIADAGAYGMSMASTYNLHRLPQEIILR